MGEFLSAKAYNKLGAFFQKVRGAGVPPKATGSWLKSLGFTSSDDVTMLPVLKALAFVDSSGAPTDAWKKYRGSDHQHVMGIAVKRAYQELFQTYPDAPTRTSQDLTSFFKTHTLGGEKTIQRTVGTFKSLAALADFTHVRDGEENVPNPRGGSRGESLSHQSLPPAPPASSPALHIDVQIHIAADASPDQIDQIFASMAKHLYGKH